MAFYKKVFKAMGKKWYPQAVRVGKPITTEQVARRLAAESTVSPADVAAVLRALSGVMADYMAQGRSVKLDGIGSFYFTISAANNGKAKAEDVTAADIRSIRVRFLPETRFRQGGGTRITTRSLTDADISWEEWQGKTTP